MVLVTDRFAWFADGERVLTISQFQALASSYAHTGSGCAWVLHAGLGIERSDWDALQSVDRIHNELELRIADPESLRMQAVSPATVHKRRAENVLLADFQQMSELRCSAALRVSGDNEFVLDYRSARHVPEMVIIEAMRQICCAHFETGYRTDLPPREYMGVWHRMSLNFGSFLFALPARLVCEIVEADLEKETNLRFRAAMTVRQNGGVVASAEIGFSMIEKERIGALERSKAARAVQAQLVGPR